MHKLGEDKAEVHCEDLRVMRVHGREPMLCLAAFWMMAPFHFAGKEHLVEQFLLNVRPGNTWLVEEGNKLVSAAACFARESVSSFMGWPT